MALWTPQRGRLRVEHNLGTIGSNTYGTAVTTDATLASTKGTAVELITATAFDAYEITVVAHGYSTTSTASDGALDILVGAATEDILIPNLLMGYCGTTTIQGMQGKHWTFPLYIPAGTRIAAQVAGNRLATVCRVGVILSGGDGAPHGRLGRKVTTYGMGTVPDGTSITPGLSGAAGSFTQITAATSEDHFAFLPSLQPNSETLVQNQTLLAAIGVGAATEEEIGQWMAQADIAENMSGWMRDRPALVDVPSGTRLAMRVSSSHSASDAFTGVIHAVS